MAATTWNVSLAMQSNNTCIPTVQKTVTISGGTARALPTQDQGAFEQLIAATERGRRTLSRQFKLGNITPGSTGNLLITINSPGPNQTYTPTVNTGGTPSGTNVALPLHEVSAAIPWPEAIERGIRLVLRQIADGN
mgnify:CR=1 FL=1